MTHTCPLCGKQMRPRNGKNGRFWGCSNYPQCRGTRDWGDPQNDDTCESFDEQNARHEEPFDWRD